MKVKYCWFFFSSFIWLSRVFFFHFHFFFVSIEQWKKFCPWKPCRERLPTKRFEKFVLRNLSYWRQHGLVRMQGPVSRKSRNFSGDISLFISSKWRHSETWSIAVNLISFPLQHIKRPALQNKRVGVLQMAFLAWKVFGTFEKRAPGLEINSLIELFYLLMILFSRYKSCDITRRFEPLLCYLKRPCANMKILD